MTELTKEHFDPFPHADDPARQEWVPIINSLPIIADPLGPFLQKAVHDTIEFILFHAEVPCPPVQPLILERKDGTIDVVRINPAKDNWFTIQRAAQVGGSGSGGGDDDDDVVDIDPAEVQEKPARLLH